MQKKWSFADGSTASLNPPVIGGISLIEAVDF
jgi:hypothetical protein